VDEGSGEKDGARINNTPEEAIVTTSGESSTRNRATWG
jgi:hypothetical protein